MNETPKEKVLSSLLFLSKEELMEINQKINALLGSRSNASDQVKEYFRNLKNTEGKLVAIKEYNDKMGCGLKEAKEYIDEL